MGQDLEKNRGWKCQFGSLLLERCEADESVQGENIEGSRKA